MFLPGKQFWAHFGSIIEVKTVEVIHEQYMHVVIDTKDSNKCGEFREQYRERVCSEWFQYPMYKNGTLTKNAFCNVTVLPSFSSSGVLQPYHLVKCHTYLIRNTFSKNSCV